MSGFHDNSNNNSFKQGLFDIIIDALIKSCELMGNNCLAHNIRIENHEEKIRNYLVENYLENDEIRPLIGLSKIKLRFDSEVLENYNKQSNSYVGRTDIRVISEDFFNNRNNYFIIECKRIDMSKQLCQRYVEDGICRFTGINPKYKSFNGVNIMLGFIVADIIFPKTLATIKNFHTKKLGSIIVKDISVVLERNNYSLYQSAYSNALTLSHLFYNFKNIVSYNDDENNRSCPLKQA